MTPPSQPLSESRASEISGNVFPKPQAYDLTDPKERLRLLRECRGYLHTCRRAHHGTDMDGRWFAIEALEEWISELRRIDPTPPQRDSK